MQKASPAPITKSESGESSVSIYRGEPATAEEVFVGMNRLRTAFPKMSPEFFNLLSERVTAKKFTSARLRDAVNHLIDNFSYKELNVSDVIKFDKRHRLYTYNEVCALVGRGAARFTDFKVIEIDGKPYRVKTTED